MQIERRKKYFEDVFKATGNPDLIYKEFDEPKEEELPKIEPYEPVLKRKYGKKEKEAVDKIKKELGIKRLTKPRKGKI